MKWAFLLCIFLGVDAGAVERLAVVGDAYDASGDNLLYQEFHYYSEDGLDHRVVYLSPEKQPIATKTINYRDGYMTPTFSQQAYMSGELIRVVWSGNDLLMEYSAQGDPVSEKKVPVSKPLVIDAGFDHFIRGNWHPLLEGRRLAFYFAAPARLSLVKLVVEKKAACSYLTTVDTCFRVNSSNWLVRLLLDSIELGYNSKSKKLSRFRGLGNITDQSGGNINVDIRYRYQPLCEAGITCITEG